MKHFKIFAMLLSIVCLAACGSKQRNTSSSETEYETDASDWVNTIIIPSGYDSATVEQNVTIAFKDGKAYFFQRGEKLFDTGADTWFINEYNIVAYDKESGHTTLYFRISAITVDNVLEYTELPEALMCRMSDDSYRFYNKAGEITAIDLKHLVYIQKLENDIYISESYFTFATFDGNQRLLFDSDGNLKYAISLTTWQRLAIRYLKRDLDEGRPYKWTYTYNINLHKFIADQQSGQSQTFYEPE